MSKYFTFSKNIPVDIIIRSAGPEDVPALTLLSGQLGYPQTEKETLRHLQVILGNKEEAVLVAVAGNKLAGWIGLVNTMHLCAGHYCQISGLVVDEAFHRKGIGKQLISAARDWALAKGITRLKVNCNTKRKEAHLFYTRLGFAVVKEQKQFMLDLQ